MAKKILGLDLGLQSVGWAVVEMDDSDTPPKPPIVAAGVRIFLPAEVQKTWESPGLKRRTCRGQRRRLRRLRGRMNKIRVLFLKHGLLSGDYNINPTGKPVINLAKIHTLHQEQNRAQGYDLWKLRVAALERKLEAEEWVAVLTQLAKRRGFKSNRKIPKEAKDETGKMLTEANKNKKLLSEKYRTVGEMLAKDERFAKNGVQIKRNKGGKKDAKPEHYTRTVLREQLDKEIIELFECQRGFGNLHSGKELEKEYLEIWGYQRHFDQGNIEEMVGECPFEKGQKRAPKMSYTAESCKVWQEINHNLKTRNITANTNRPPLTDEEKQSIFNRAQTAEKLTYADVRKEWLKLNHCEGVVYKFKSVFYRSEDEQFRTKVKTMVLFIKDKNDKTPPPKISDAQHRKIYECGLADMSITYADIRRILELDDRFYIKGCKPAEDPAEAEAEAKEFYKFPGFKKLHSALGEHWQRITGSHEQRAEKLAELAELCMFAGGEHKSTMLAEKFGSEVAHALKKTTLLQSEDEKKETFTAMSGTYQIWQAAKGELWELLLQHPQTLDTIAEAVTYYKEDENIRKHLQPLKEQYSEKDFAAIEKLALRLDFSGIAGLSLVALRNILPHLQQGCVYSDACEKTGYEHSRPQTFVKRKKLPIIIDAQKARHLSPEMQQKLESGEAVKLEISNPRVLRAITQARKIVNAVVQQHDIDQVHIELLRDVARSPKERREIKKGQDNFREERKRVSQRLKDVFPGYHPSNADILKMRLCMAQNDRCPYSGEHMEPERLLDAGAFEIDHILPLSRSMDDSNNNKVLCLTAENRRKGNRIPYEYLGGDAQRWKEFQTRIKHYPIGRRERMEKTEFNDEQAQEHREKWVESPESKWIAREFKNLLENHLQFASDKTGDNKKRVQTRNGALTGFLRAQWGLHKNRDTHGHHALDAIVVACSTQSLVQRVSKWSKRKELWKTDEKAGVETVDPETGEIVETRYQKKEIPVPWGTLGYFHQDVLDSVSNIFVSQPARRKMSGEAHGETLDKINKTSQHPVRDGNKHGIPQKWNILRTDVFRKKGKYYLSLVRPYHLVKGELPQHYIIAGESETGGKLDESFEFQFSLFPRDAVCIRKKANQTIKERFPPDKTHAGVLWDQDGKFVTIVGYFRTSHKTSGTITIEAHDKSWGGEKNLFSPGVQGLLSIQKLEIPLLGGVCINDIVQKEKFVVKGERRHELAKPGSRKPGKT